MCFITPLEEPITRDKMIHLTGEGACLVETALEGVMGKRGERVKGQAIGTARCPLSALLII
jgi:hypothetical protein